MTCGVQPAVVDGWGVSVSITVVEAVTVIADEVTREEDTGVLRSM
ncbi:hypothetical protein [Kistimonas scapharcae]